MDHHSTASEMGMMGALRVASLKKAAEAASKNRTYAGWGSLELLMRLGDLVDIYVSPAKCMHACPVHPPLLGSCCASRRT